jgi:hypothetical protein
MKLSLSNRKPGQRKKKASHTKREAVIKEVEWLPAPQRGESLLDFRQRCLEDVRSWGLVEVRIPIELQAQHD